MNARYGMMSFSTAAFGRSESVSSSFELDVIEQTLTTSEVEVFEPIVIGRATEMEEVLTMDERALSD